MGVWSGGLLRPLWLLEVLVFMIDGKGGQQSQLQTGEACIQVWG